jgi:hypothetical protein
VSSQCDNGSNAYRAGHCGALLSLAPAVQQQAGESNNPCITSQECAQCNNSVAGQQQLACRKLLCLLQVLDYLTHQRLLFPALATTYAMHLSMNRLKVCLRMQVGTWLCSRFAHIVLEEAGERMSPGGGVHSALSASSASICQVACFIVQLLAKDRRPKDAKLVHVRSSGLKAAATWHRVEILQVSGTEVDMTFVAVAAGRLQAAESKIGMCCQ